MRAGPKGASPPRCVWTFVGCEGFFQLRKQGREREASAVSHRASERRGERRPRGNSAALHIIVTSEDIVHIQTP